MKPNVGIIDTMIRFILGTAAMFFSFSGHSIYWYILGGLVLLSGIARYCPAYTIVGINTCRD